MPLTFGELAALAAAGSGGGAFVFLRSARRDRLFAGTPRVRIRSAAQGYVHVRGRTAAGEDGVLSAPLSGSPCVWWSYESAQRVRDSDRKVHWEVIDSATSVTPFRIEDGDGACLVGPVGAEIRPTAQDLWYGDSPRPVRRSDPATRVPVLEAMDAEYRYREQLISVGAWLSVLGELRSASAVTAGEEQARELLRNWKGDQAMLLARFDRNHDGHIDAAEWEAARAASLAQVRIGGDVQRLSVIGQCTHGEPFVVSTLDEQQLVGRERRNALLGLAASVLFAALALWALARA